MDDYGGMQAVRLSVEALSVKMSSTLLMVASSGGSIMDLD